MIETCNKIVAGPGSAACDAGTPKNMVPSLKANPKLTDQPSPLPRPLLAKTVLRSLLASAGQSDPWCWCCSIVRFFSASVFLRRWLGLHASPSTSRRPANTSRSEFAASPFQLARNNALKVQQLRRPSDLLCYGQTSVKGLRVQVRKTLRRGWTGVTGRSPGWSPENGANISNGSEGGRMGL